MPRATVIGGSGHIGTYLVPRLVEAGFEVTNFSRGRRKPYRQHAAWEAVEQISIDREAADAASEFAAAVMAARPDIVIDLICYQPESAQQLIAHLADVAHLIHVGTIWVHGASALVPTRETQPRRPVGLYGVRKAQIESLLLDAAGSIDLPVTIIHPAHIVGPGWSPSNPAAYSGEGGQSFHLKADSDSGRTRTAIR